MKICICIEKLLYKSGQRTGGVAAIEGQTHENQQNFPLNVNCDSIVNMKPLHAAFYCLLILYLIGKFFRSLKIETRRYLDNQRYTLYMFLTCLNYVTCKQSGSIFQVTCMEH